MSQSRSQAQPRPMELFDLAGQVAIVTGSSRGLGRAMAAGLLGAGASVVICGRSQAQCTATAASLAPRAGAEILPLACDVGDWDAIPGFVDAVHRHFGRIDVLVNNAGINPRKMAIEEITQSSWDEIFRVNLQGPLRFGQCVAPIMGQGGGGAIVNVASVAAHGGRPRTTAYAASKAGLLSLTKSMAIAWAPSNIRVNAISPGPFQTELFETSAKTIPGFAEDAANATLMKRVGSPDEITGAVLYLASDASSFVTGEDLVVSGGY